MSPCGGPRARGPPQFPSYAGDPRGLVSDGFSTEVTNCSAQPSLDCDQGPFDLAKARQHRVIGIASAAVRHFGYPLGDVGYHCGDRGEFGCVRIHRLQSARDFCQSAPPRPVACCRADAH